VIQKFVDQGISVNTSYNPRHYEGEQIPMSELMKHVVTFYKYGGKQLYYMNVSDGSGEIEISDKGTLQLEPIDEQSCDSCTI